MPLADLLPDYNGLYRIASISENPTLTTGNPTDSNAFSMDKTVGQLQKNAKDTASAAASDKATGEAAGQAAYSAGAASDAAEGAAAGAAGEEAASSAGEAADLLSDKNLKVDVQGLKPEHLTAAIARLSRPRKLAMPASRSVSKAAFSK